MEFFYADTPLQAKRPNQSRIIYFGYELNTIFNPIEKAIKIEHANITLDRKG